MVAHDNVKQTPDLEDPETVSLDGRSSVAQRQLRNITKHLELACEIAAKAVAQVDREMENNGRKGGKRPDLPLYELVLGLRGVYKKIALKWVEPDHGDAIKGESPEFLTFLGACLSPLENEKRTLRSLSKLYVRARDYEDRGDRRP
jgi:hypothetical protein